ncbi:MAG TPA: tetratricopeptide repeat protein [Candidatus Methylomirabilis sp.]|nr:tetratricopeptide repeat protein [Candidatus Methylomirabilis sp.]
MRLQMLLLVVLLFLLGCGDTSPVGRSSSDLDAISKIYKQGDPKSAIEKLNEYLKSKPNDDMAWTILGNAYLDLDQQENAEAAYKKALEINSNGFQAITSMGILRRKQGKYDEALAYYEKALAINPKYAQAYSSMTVIALKQEKDAKALEYAKKAYDLDRTDPVIVANLAVAYHYNGMAELRGKTTKEAKKLGYAKIDRLEKIYSGELTIRD